MRERTDAARGREIDDSYSEGYDLVDSIDNDVTVRSSKADLVPQNEHIKGTLFAPGNDQLMEEDYTNMNEPKENKKSKVNISQYPDEAPKKLIQSSASPEIDQKGGLRQKVMNLEASLEFERNLSF